MTTNNYGPGPGLGAPARPAPIDDKHTATVTARAALVGLVLMPLADGAWQVLNQFGQPTTLQSLQAAEALIYGCELVRSDVAALLERLRAGAQQGGAS